MAADRSQAHSARWAQINTLLKRCGYSVTWYDNVDTGDYRYTLTRLYPEYERLGYYDDEPTALRMVYMLLNAEEEI